MAHITVRLKGGAGSGNFAHAGIPGHLGGSAPSGYYSGDPKTATVKEVYDGSTADIQELAHRTGLLAMDDESKAYIEQFAIDHPNLVKSTAPSVKYIKDYANNIQPYDAAQEAEAAQYWAPGASRANANSWSPYYRRTCPIENIPSSFYTGQTKPTNLTDDEWDIAKKMADIQGKGYTAQRAGGGWNSAAKNQVYETEWNALTDDEKTRALDLHTKCLRAEWINQNVPRTLFVGSRRDPYAHNFKDIEVGDVDSTPGLDIVRYGYDYRSTFLKKVIPPKVLPMSGYDVTDMAGLKKLTDDEEKGYKTWMETTWDTTKQSGKMKINNMFRMISQPAVRKDYDQALADKDNEFRNGFHSTSYENAQSIARSGFLQRPPSVGRCLGDGLYVAEKASKAGLYIGAQYGASPGTRGVMFIVNAARGVAKKITDISSGYASGCDTVQGAIGSFATGPRGGKLWLNDEMAVRNPRAVWAKVWMDVEVADLFHFI